MPNLEIFSNAGFPFTRVADLSDTTVVLPHTPTEQEIETFVTLMGHFGRQTGFPGLRVTVAGPDALRDGANTDFLIIGSGNDQPGFDRLGTHLPVSLGSGQIQVRDTQGLFVKLLHHAWWKLESNEHSESGMLTAAGTPDAIIEGIKSPYDVASSRSIVAIHLKDGAAFAPFMDAFLEVQQSHDISGSVAVFHGAQFASFRIGSEVYHVGVLPWWIYLMLWFTERPWLAALVVIVLAFLVAIWTRQWLRSRARERLTMVGN
jgi:cellulose synthase (UDP-forming)